MSELSFSAAHRRRLRDVYRSAGWPCQDVLEVELLAAGLLERCSAPSGHDTLRVTDAGIALIADTLRRNRARREAHEDLVERVAREMTRSGRIAWRGLSLRARVGEAWAMAMPDVFSIRQTTVEAYVEPIVHEVKVKRSDLLSDLRKPLKRAAYLQLSSQCWYVIQEGIAAPSEIPPECGVMLASGRTGLLDVARPAPRRPMQMSFGLWMALARATPLEGCRLEDAQGLLGEIGEAEDPSTSAH